MRIIKVIMISLVLLTAGIAATTFVVVQMPQFGKKPTGSHFENIKNSPQHNGKAFENPGGISVSMNASTLWKILKSYTKPVKEKRPTQLPVNQINPDSIQQSEGDDVRLTWFGHSAFLLQVGSKNILLDPMLGPSAAPFSFQVKRFSQELPIEIEQLPAIDAVVFSHDHYDHLDYPTVLALKDRVKHFYVPLGLKSHLIHWGVDSSAVSELDWWQETQVEDVLLACTPSQHFSGRSINDRGSTLWCSWVIRTPTKNIFFSGDSGYFSGFKSIGEKYGPFDIALVECGQYNVLWKEIHMMPEETAQAAVDLQAQALLPIHWGMFELALHPWKEPVQRLSVKANELNMPLVTPRIGQTLDLNNISNTETWWESL